MRNVFVLLIAVLASSVALADGPTVAFKYVDASGVVSFTDSEKRIPAKYAKSAEKIELGELGNYERFTEVAVAPVVVKTPAPVVAVTPAPVAKRDCGTVVVRSERRDVKTNSGGDNTRFFIAEDDCGVLYDSPFYPEFIVRR